MGLGNKTLTAAQKKLLTEARHILHSLAEPSEREFRTKRFLMDFIAANTDLPLYDRGKWFYALHREQNAQKTIVIRADIDAVVMEGGLCEHRCGHDGHAAALLGLALLLNGGVKGSDNSPLSVGNNVVLLFQHAEETGVGAVECLELFNEIPVDHVIGCHNVPQTPMGTILIRNNTFACASCGAVIELSGSPAHAAYPENGKNPAQALAYLVNELPCIAQRLQREYNSTTLATIVGISCGGESFGVAASDGILRATLRAESDAAFDRLLHEIDDAVCNIATANGLLYSLSYRDRFPSSVNNQECVKRLVQSCKNNKLPYCFPAEPFRWSEDFGHFAKRKSCVIFGIGAGMDTAPLHTKRYEYPNELIAYTVNAFMAYITNNA